MTAILPTVGAAGAHGAPPRVPVSTYRLQLGPDLTFDDAARQVPYLASLGVTHLYLSPVLQAAPGSTHGYDVVDHSRVSDELGGRDPGVPLDPRFVHGLLVRAPGPSPR